MLRLIGTENFEINISVPLILVYQDVLLRQLGSLSLSEGDADSLIDYYCAVSQQHEIFYLWRPTLRDPQDEMLLELAVKARCGFLITFNGRDLAQREGVAINQLITLTVAEKMSALMTEEYLAERAKRASQEKYEAVLAKVPDVAPEEYD